MTRAFHPLDPRGARLRVLSALLLGAIAWLVLPDWMPLSVRALAAWDVSAVVLLVFVGSIIIRGNVDETRRRAASEDPGRVLGSLVALGGSAISVLGAASIVHGVATASRVSSYGVFLCVATVALSWTVTHAVFTLRYAHLYYGGASDDAGGFKFPGDDAPDDRDFAYVAFTVGMTFQVSDVVITERRVRRTVLLHSLLSFLYNTIIVALVLNLVAGRLGS